MLGPALAGKAGLVLCQPSIPVMKQVSALSDEQLAVGAALKRAREDAGLTTTQVSEATRVRRSLIEAIERGNFSVPGGEVYARGHIKAIAAVLGIDSGPLLARLDTQPAVDPGPPEPAPAPPPAAHRRPATAASLASTLGAKADRAPRPGPNWSGVMVAALALVIAVGAIQLYRSSSSGQRPLAVPSSSPAPSSSVASPPLVTPSHPPVSPPASSGTNPSTSSAPSTTTSATPGGGVLAQGDAVTVVVNVTGRACWMRVTTATQTLFEGTLTRGVTRTFQDRSKVKLLLGNAGGVSLVVNGVDLGHPGGSGQVTTVVFGPGNPTLSQA